MKKVAVKVKLADRGRATLPLKESGKRLGEEFKEFDRIFLPMGYAQAYGGADKAPKLIIRTVSRGGKDTYQLIFKRFVTENIVLYYQTQIFDYAQLAHIVTHIGYEFYGQVSKVRAQVLAGDTLFSLDTIDNHESYYLKIEKIVADDAPVDVHELEDVLASLDLGEAERLNQEYIEIERKEK